MQSKIYTPGSIDTSSFNKPAAYSPMSSGASSSSDPKGKITADPTPPIIENDDGLVGRVTIGFGFIFTILMIVGFVRWDMFKDEYVEPGSRESERDKAPAMLILGCVSTGLALIFWALWGIEKRYKNIISKILGLMK